ncbi:MAG: hypothetical protein EXS55_02295 [Candidatus Magasanikbacteria bacterium]|nr:hypothetical protein [Candidatus Magasanikbacteria bacterium]
MTLEPTLVVQKIRTLIIEEYFDHYMKRLIAYHAQFKARDLAGKTGRTEYIKITIPKFEDLFGSYGESPYKNKLGELFPGETMTTLLEQFPLGELITQANETAAQFESFIGVCETPADFKALETAFAERSEKMKQQGEGPITIDFTELKGALEKFLEAKLGSTTVESAPSRTRRK